MRFEDKVKQISYSQGVRFSRLPEIPKAIAAQGIMRHLKACKTFNCPPEVDSIREIIDDALAKRAVWTEYVK